MKIPKSCPNCNSPRLAEILYGLPRFDDELDNDIKEGRIVLGGCCVTDNDPDYKCVDCNALIFKDTGRYIFSEEDDF
jgi:primosomal protein N'